MKEKDDSDELEDIEEKKDEKEKEKDEESSEDKDEDNLEENVGENIEENIEEIKTMKLEDIKANEKKVEENKPEGKKEKKLISEFEYKTYIVEQPDTNIICSEDNNKINFISLNLLISKINDNTFDDTNKNLIYSDILLYLVYQKNALMTNEVFFDIINSLINSNNINTALFLLNTYLVNYYTTEILPLKDIQNKVINLYKLTNRQEITFKLLYDKDKQIELSKLIEYIIEGKIDIINSLGGMENIREKDNLKETIIPEATDYIFDVFNWDPIELARQITIITQYLYRNIGCQELLLGGWTKKDKMEKSPNITKLIIRFNKISRWIMEEILSYDSSKNRAKVIEFFLSVAEELRNINNLNDCFAVITTFNHLCIKRLKKTWKNVSQISKEKLKQLSKLCSILKNFEAIKTEFIQYKNNITNINELEEGCIPYLAPYLKDLAFLEEGHKYFNDNKLINIHKLLIVGKNIRNIKESQMFVYSYKPVYALAILSDPEPLEDNELTALSEALEPKFKLNSKRSKIKRKTNTETKYEKYKLSQLFLEFLKDYGISLQKKMSLRERIELFQKQYTPIHNVQSSSAINRTMNLSTSFNASMDDQLGIRTLSY